MMEKICKPEDFCIWPIANEGHKLGCACSRGYLNIQDSCCLNQNWIIGLACGGGAILILFILIVSYLACSYKREVIKLDALVRRSCTTDYWLDRVTSDEGAPKNRGELTAVQNHRRKTSKKVESSKRDMVTQTSPLNIQLTQNNNVSRFYDIDLNSARLKELSTPSPSKGGIRQLKESSTFKKEERQTEELSTNIESPEYVEMDNQIVYSNKKHNILGYQPTALVSNEAIEKLHDRPMSYNDAYSGPNKLYFDYNKSYYPHQENHKASESFSIKRPSIISDL